MRVDTSYLTNNGSYSWNTPQYIVVHYTAGADGVTAEANARYYYNNGGNIECGTHYFLGDDGIFASTPESRGAWTNGNYQANTHAVNIEVACGSWEPEFTVKERELLAELVQDIMRRYNIPAENVIRHYDIVDRFSGQTFDPHKHCPRPYIDEAKWRELHEEITGDEMKPTELMQWQWSGMAGNDYGQHGKGTGDDVANFYNINRWAYGNTCELIEAVDDLRKRLDAIETGGIDYEKLAKAVCDEQARRMRE